MPTSLPPGRDQRDDAAGGPHRFLSRFLRGELGAGVTVAVISGIILAIGGAVWGAVTSGRGNAPPDRRFGYYPERTVYRCRVPSKCLGADHVAFNSHVNTASAGDERAFMDARFVQATVSGSFRNELHVKVGDTLVVRGYVNNSANPALTQQRRDIAVNTRFQVILPNKAIGGEKETALYGQITADNARPRLVGDTVKLVSREAIRVQYIDGSAVLYTKNGPLALPDTIVGDGTLIGSSRLDGRIPGSFTDAVTVQLKIRIASGDAPLN